MDAGVRKDFVAWLREHGITEVEDVSYVSSPFLPLSVRKSEKPMTSNAHRAGEAVTGESNIKDELSDVFSSKVSLVDLARRLEKDLVIWEKDVGKFKLGWKSDMIFESDGVEEED